MSNRGPIAVCIDGRCYGSLKDAFRRLCIESTSGERTAIRQRLRNGEPVLVSFGTTRFLVSALEHTQEVRL